MQRDIQANEIDWVFCWRTSTGDVRPGARDTSVNGRPVPYRPDAVKPEAGIRAIVRGRVRTCPFPPIGPSLDQQGAISRMCAFGWGYVTEPWIVPARDERELGVLREAARAAVRSGDASVWALASLRARGEVRWAIHVSALPAVVRELANRVGAAWTLRVKEKLYGTWLKGAQIFVSSVEGHEIAILEADAVFDDARLPPGRDGEVNVDRPTGPGAWEKWVTMEPRKQTPSRPVTGDNPNWDKDMETLKEEIYVTWKEEHPDGTWEQFDDGWGAVTAVFGT